MGVGFSIGGGSVSDGLGPEVIELDTIGSGDVVEAGWELVWGGEVHLEIDTVEPGLVAIVPEVIE